MQFTNIYYGRIGMRVLSINIYSELKHFNACKTSWVVKYSFSKPLFDCLGWMLFDRMLGSVLTFVLMRKPLYDDCQILTCIDILYNIDVFSSTHPYFN